MTLRTMALAMLALLVPALRGAEAEDHAVKVIEKLGGRFSRNPNQPGSPILGANLGDATPLADALEELAVFPRLQQLELSCSELRDAHLKQLLVLRGLRELNLSFTGVTDEGLQTLGCLPGLRHLDLRGTPITDAGLKHLAGLENLRSLNLCGSQVTMVGVNELQQALPECGLSFD